MPLPRSEDIPGFPRTIVPRGFTDQGWRNFVYLARQLKDHLNPGWMFTGSVALRVLMALYHRDCYNLPAERAYRDNEIDLVVRDFTSVRPSLFEPGSGFVLLCCHMDASPHRKDLSTRYWMVLHPESGVRLNIWESRDPQMQPHEEYVISHTPRIPFIGLADLFLAILQDAAKPEYNQPFDPKQIQDLRLLADLFYRYGLPGQFPSSHPEELGDLISPWKPGYQLPRKLAELWDIRRRDDRTTIGALDLDAAVMLAVAPGYPNPLIKSDPYRPSIANLLGRAFRRGCHVCRRRDNYSSYRPALGLHWMSRYGFHAARRWLGIAPRRPVFRLDTDADSAADAPND